SSHKIARATGQGTAGRFSEALTTTVEFEPKEFERFVAARAAAYRQAREELQRATQPWLEVEYLEAARPEGRRRIVEFIGADPSFEIEVPTKKRNTSRIVDRFTNPDEVMGYLEQHGLQHWASEGQP